MPQRNQKKTFNTAMSQPQAENNKAQSFRRFCQLLCHFNESTNETGSVLNLLLKKVLDFLQMIKQSACVVTISALSRMRRFIPPSDQCILSSEAPATFGVLRILVPASNASS